MNERMPAAFATDGSGEGVNILQRRHILCAALSRLFGCRAHAHMPVCSLNTVNHDRFDRVSEIKYANEQTCDVL